MPSAAHLQLAAPDTGPIGLPKAKQLMMSVPPLMLPSRTSRFMSRYTKSIAVRAPADFPSRGWRRSDVEIDACRSGATPSFSSERQIFRAGAEHGDSLAPPPSPQNGRIGGASGAPSYSTIVDTEGQADTSQFHIIQPHVVK